MVSARNRLQGLNFTCYICLAPLNVREHFRHFTSKRAFCYSISRA